MPQASPMLCALDVLVLVSDCCAGSELGICFPSFCALQVVFDLITSKTQANIGEVWCPLSMAMTAAELALLKRLQECVTVNPRQANALTDKRDSSTGFGRVLDTVKPANVVHMLYDMRRAKGECLAVCQLTGC